MFSLFRKIAVVLAATVPLTLAGCSAAERGPVEEQVKPTPDPKPKPPTPEPIPAPRPGPTHTGDPPPEAAPTK